MRQVTNILGRRSARDEGVVGRLGTVVELRDGLVLVESEGRQLARRATSCLVAPVLGDTVIVAMTELGAFVLAVLERENEDLVTLSAGEDTDLELRARRVRAVGTETVEIVTQGSFRAIAGRFLGRAVESELSVDRATFVAGALRTQVSKLQIVADTIDSVANRVVERVKRSYRAIEGVDQVRAGQVDYRAEGVMALRSEQTVMTARDVVKVDGSQIHLG